MSTESAQLQLRNANLQELSKMVVNGQIIFKMDHIAVINLNGRHLFNVFRRYNSVFEMVIEDCHGDIFFHKDYTVKESMQRLLALTAETQQNLYIINVHEFHKNAPTVGDTNELNMRWSEIHRSLHGAIIDLGLLFEQQDQDEPLETAFPTRYRCKRKCCYQDHEEESEEEEEEEEEEEDSEEQEEEEEEEDSEEQEEDSEEQEEEEQEDSEESDEPPVKYKILRNGKKIAVK
jgi:hypothetical protein